MTLRPHEQGREELRSGARRAGEDNRWTIDPESAVLRFEVKMLFGLKQVWGEFHGVQGAAILNNQGGLEALSVTVESGSLTTGLPRRDAHLLSRDFLDAQHYPAMTFVSTAITPLAEGHWFVEGKLCLRGVTQATGLEVTAVQEQGGRRAVSVNGVLQRRAWKMTFGLPLIGPEVRYRRNPGSGENLNVIPVLQRPALGRFV